MSPSETFSFLQDIYSWTHVCFVAQAFESREHSTPLKAFDRKGEVYIVEGTLQFTQMVKFITFYIVLVFNCTHYLNTTCDVSSVFAVLK